MELYFSFIIFFGWMANLLPRALSVEGIPVTEAISCFLARVALSRGGKGSSALRRQGILRCLVIRTPLLRHAHHFRSCRGVGKCAPTLSSVLTKTVTYFVFFYTLITLDETMHSQSCADGDRKYGECQSDVFTLARSSRDESRVTAA